MVNIPCSLPHIFKSNLNFIFFAIRDKLFIKIHIVLKKLFRVTLNVIFKMLTRVNYNVLNT